MVNGAVAKEKAIQRKKKSNGSVKKWVYLFDEVDLAQESVGGSWDATRALLGGKGANLGEMTRIALPVPPGFTVTTEACNWFVANKYTFPAGMWEQVLESLEYIEEKTGKQFGNLDNPLLVSVRSGAKNSMPGMMDTVLNLGMNDVIAERMVELTHDERFVYNAYRRLVQLFGAIVMYIEDEAFEDHLTAVKRQKGVGSDTELSAKDWREITEKFKEIYKEHVKADFPQEPLEQLKLAMQAVFKS